MRIEGIGQPGCLAPAKANDRKSDGSFARILDALQDVSELQQTADQKARQLALGDDVEIHEVMIASEKAALALELTVAVRNKMLEAYQELMRMQV